MEKRAASLKAEDLLEEEDEDEEEEEEEEEEEKRRNQSQSMETAVAFGSSPSSCESQVTPPSGAFKVRFTAEELELLEEVFKKNKRPSKRLRTKIANELSLPPKNIRVWFQNRRAKAKKTAGNSSCTFGSANKSRKIRVGVNFDVIRSLNEEEVKLKAKKTESEKIPYLSVIKMEDTLKSSAFNSSSSSSSSTPLLTSKSHPLHSGSTTSTTSTTTSRSHHSSDDRTMSTQLTSITSCPSTPSPYSSFTPTSSHPYAVSPTPTSPAQPSSPNSYPTPLTPTKLNPHQHVDKISNAEQPNRRPGSYIPILPAGVTSWTSAPTPVPTGVANPYPPTGARMDIFSIYPEPIRMSDPLNSRDQMGNTAILRASEKGHVKEFANLLKAGADVRLTNLEGDDPLLAAIKRGFVHIIDAFVSFIGKRQINMIVIPLFQRPLLHVATAWRQIGICKYLLENGADLTLPDLEGKTALDVAVERNYGEMIIIFNQFISQNQPPSTSTTNLLPSGPPPLSPLPIVQQRNFDPYAASSPYFPKSSHHSTSVSSSTVNQYGQYSNPNLKANHVVGGNHPSNNSKVTGMFSASDSQMHMPSQSVNRQHVSGTTRKQVRDEIRIDSDDETKEKSLEEGTRAGSE